MKKFLIVDDDTELRSSLAEVLQGEGYATEEAASGREALKKIASEEFDVVLLDMMMPEMDGMETLMELKRSGSRSKVVMITAFATIGNAVEAIKKGASDYISKPFKIEVLLTTIRRVLEESRFEEDTKDLDLDFTLSSLSNPIRRNILHLLNERGSMRLMELTRELDIEDHTKVVFHLKMLRESGIIEQNEDKSYVITKEGNRTVSCLKLIQSHLLKRKAREA